MSTELSNTTKRNIRAVAKKRAKAIAKKAMKGNKAAKLRALKLREQALKLRQQALKAEKEAKLRALKLEQAALKAKRDVEHAARVAAATAQRIAQQIATGVCKVSLTTAQVAAKIEAMILGPIKKELAKALKMPQAQKALHQAIAIIKQRQARSIQRVIEAATILAHPNNARIVKQLMDPNKMCERPERTVRRTFQKLIGGPIRQALAVINYGQGPQVRSRGTLASASLALGGNLAKIGGGEIGVRYAFDFVNKSHWFLDLAGMVKSNIGGGGGVQLGIFPGKNPAQTGGWFMGAGVSFPLPKIPKAMGGGLDFYFDIPLEIKMPFALKWNLTSPKFFLDHFQGFGVSFGGGKNIMPADIALKIGGGVRLGK